MSDDQTTTGAEYTYWQIVVIWLMLGCGTFYLVYSYANKRTHWYIYCSTFIGWLFPISTVLLLPLDLSSSLYQECLDGLAVGNGTVPGRASCDEPLLVASETFLLTSWRGIYWSMFALSYFINPFLSAYVDSGYFSVLERAKKSIRANLIYYGILGILGGAGLVYALFIQNLDMSTLMDLAMTCANLFGLFLVIVYMAFGLIQVPRDCWTLGDYKKQLRALEFKAPKIKDELNDTEADYYDLAKEIYGIAKSMSEDDPLRPYVDIMIANCPLGQGVGDLGEMSAEYRDLDMVKLAKLHKEIKRAAIKKRRYEWEFNNLCLNAFLYQDLIALKNETLNGKYEPKFRFIRSDDALAAGELELVSDSEFGLKYPFFKGIIARSRWLWYFKVQPWFWRALTVLLVIMSVIVIWADTTYIVQSPIISIIGNIYHSDDVSYAFLEMASVGFLVYNCICCIHTLFRVRIFNMYSLHPNHNTAETSLTWFTSQMTRLTFPLCYNFIYMADSKNVALFKLMGTMTGEKYIKILPLILGILVLCNLLNVFSRLLRCCGFSDDFMDSSDERKPGEWDNVEDGKLILTEIRSNLERKADRVLRGAASTGLLSEYRSGNTASSRNKSIAETEQSNTSFTLPKRKAKDLSQTTSKYLLNNPLYEKYQKKFRGEDGSSITENAQHDQAEKDRQSLLSTKPVSAWKNTHEEKPNTATFIRMERTPSPDKSAVKPASRLSSGLHSTAKEDKRDLLKNDALSSEWNTSQSSSKQSNQKDAKMFEGMW